MAEFLEWYQCRACGRRYRWRAELAGRMQECVCGADVFCPELKVFDEPAGPSDTLLDPEGDIGDAAPDPGIDLFPAEVASMGTPEAAAPSRVRQTSRLTSFQRACFWLAGAAIGFTLLMHAIIVQTWWYIAACAIWAPISFIKFWKAKARWQGNRSLGRAFEEELADSETA